MGEEPRRAIDSFSWRPSIGSGVRNRTSHRADCTTSWRQRKHRRARFRSTNARSRTKPIDQRTERLIGRSKCRRYPALRQLGRPRLLPARIPVLPRSSKSSIRSKTSPQTRRFARHFALGVGRRNPSLAPDVQVDLQLPGRSDGSSSKAVHIRRISTDQNDARRRWILRHQHHQTIKRLGVRPA